MLQHREKSNGFAGFHKSFVFTLTVMESHQKILMDSHMTQLMLLKENSVSLDRIHSVGDWGQVEWGIRGVGQ